MGFKDKDGNKLPMDVSLQIGDELVGKDFLRHATKDQLAERGITYEEEPLPPDQAPAPVWEESVEEWKARLKGAYSAFLHNCLVKGDWVWARKQETGQEPSSEILEYRTSLRATEKELEASVNAATTQKELHEIEINTIWPNPPGSVDPNEAE